MSYGGVYGADEICEHDNYRKNCAQCIRKRQEEVGVYDALGVLHAPNGAGTGEYCVGHVTGPVGQGRCTVLVRHCPVLNTPLQVLKNHREDAEARTLVAQAEFDMAKRRLEEARRKLDRAAAEERRWLLRDKTN